MPCLVGCLAIFMPRVVLALIWLFSDYLERAYAHIAILWPVLGFIFMPLTTLAYAFAWHQGGGSVRGLGLIVLIVAVLMDLGLLGGAGASGRRHYRVVEVKRT